MQPGATDAERGEMLDSSAVASAAKDLSGVSDQQFDRLFPRKQRFRSAWHWTPIEIAVRACSLLAPRPGMNVLDIGSGVGKVCLIGAATTEASWVGVELDAAMVGAAECAARKLRLGENLRFITGNAHDLDWSSFDALYMFNPFAEQSYDSEAGERDEGFLENVGRTQRQLAHLRIGTRVVTLHGFGGDLPDGFELVHRASAHDDFLCLWVRCS